MAPQGPKNITIQVFFMGPIDEEESVATAEIASPHHNPSTTLEFELTKFVAGGVWRDPEPGAEPEWIPGRYITRIVFPHDRYPKAGAAKRR